jgi:hypothetical protein
MPRKHRIAFAHCPHHLVQRGHNRQAVFVTDTDDSRISNKASTNTSSGSFAARFSAISSPARRPSSRKSNEEPVSASCIGARPTRRAAWLNTCLVPLASLVERKNRSVPFPCSSLILLAELAEVIARDKFAHRVQLAGLSAVELLRITGAWLTSLSRNRYQYRPAAIPMMITCSPAHSPLAPISSSRAISICSISVRTRVSRSSSRPTRCAGLRRRSNPRSHGPAPSTPAPSTHPPPSSTTCSARTSSSSRWRSKSPKTQVRHQRPRPMTIMSSPARSKRPPTSSSPAMPICSHSKPISASPSSPRPRRCAGSGHRNSGG